MSALLIAETANYTSVLSFLMPILMAVEMLVADFLIAQSFKRKQYFILRFLGSALACVMITFLMEITFSLVSGATFIYGGSDNIVNTVFKIFYYIAIFGMTFLCMFFSYEEHPSSIAVACTVGYAVQFIAANAAHVLEIASAYMPPSWAFAYNVTVYIVTWVGIYVLSYFFIKKYFCRSLYRGNTKAKLLLLLLVVIICIGLSRLSVDDTERSLLAKIVEPLYAIMCGIFIIFIQFGLSANDTMHDEVADMAELLHQEREQYRLTKESIDIINVKCHDLKHQVGLLREGVSEQHIAEIEKAIMIYDTNVKTGNDALDVLLTEKKLQCEAKKITFTCMVNGNVIEFMDDMDMYSLFGNAISNAVESVGKISDLSRRQISLKVRRVGNICSIHIENYHDGVVTFEDGLPVTDKDKDFHGFGMKSMRRIVEKYGGEMAVSAGDELFVLDIAMPCRGKNE